MIDREDPKKIEALFRDAGIFAEDFNSVRFAKTQEDADHRLASLKTKFKVGFKRLALELHPDRNSGDSAKSERLRILVLLKSHVERLQAPRIKPVTYTRGVVIHYYPTQNGVRQVVEPHHSATTVASMTPTGVRWIRVR